MQSRCSPVELCALEILYKQCVQESNLVGYYLGLVSYRATIPDSALPYPVCYYAKGGFSLTSYGVPLHFHIFPAPPHQHMPPLSARHYLAFRGSRCFAPLFKGWVLLFQPPGYISRGREPCFSAWTLVWAFGSYVVDYYPHGSLRHYSHCYGATTHLHRFRTDVLACVSFPPRRPGNPYTHFGHLKVSTGFP